MQTTFQAIQESLVLTIAYFSKFCSFSKMGQQIPVNFILQIWSRIFVSNIVFMKNTGLIVFALLISVSISTGLWFDYTNSKFESDSDYDYVTLSCQGGSGSYSWKYSSLPSGWFTRSNRIYLPRGQYKSGNYYGFKVQVSDRIYGDELKKSVFVNVGNNKISDIFDGDYNYNVADSSSVSDLINRRNTVVSQTSYGTSSTSQIRSSYSFPSINTVESRIASGDVDYVRSVINDAIGSGLSCKSVADFLSQVLSRVQGQITILAGKAETLRKELEVIQEEIVFIQSQISGLKSQTIDINALKAELTKYKADLTQYQNDRNQILRQISTSTESVRGFESQIYKVRANIRGYQADLQASISKVSAIDNQIDDLEQRIADLKAKRVSEATASDRYRKAIMSGEDEIDGYNAKIQDAQLNVRQLQAKISDSTRSINIVQSKINDLNAQIAAGNIKIDTKIAELQVTLSAKQASSAEKRIMLTDTQKVQATLQGVVGSFETSINKQYYSCYQYQGEVEQTYDKSPSTIVVSYDFGYGATSNPFLNYVSAVYGSLPTTGLSNYGYSYSGYISPISIYSPTWTRYYGSPLYDDSYNYIYGYNTNNVFNSDFSCQTNPSSSYNSYGGRIVSINKNVLGVENYRGDNKYDVHLGGCTKIETATSRGVPQVGDNVYFKGENIGSHYNAYHVTCY